MPALWHAEDIISASPAATRTPSAERKAPFLSYPALTPQRAKRASATCRASFFRRWRDWSLEVRGHHRRPDEASCQCSSAPQRLRGEEEVALQEIGEARTLAGDRAPSTASRDRCEHA